MLTDVFENFRNKCIQINEIDPARFLSVLGLAWPACLKNTQIKLQLLTNINMVAIAEKGIRGVICYTIHIKENNKYRKNYDKSVVSLYLIYLDANNLYGWAMSKRSPVNSFEWMEQVPKSNKVDDHFRNNYHENNDKGYILEVNVKYPKHLFNLYCELPFLSERKKIKKFKKLFCNIHNKENCILHVGALNQAVNID